MDVYTCTVDVYTSATVELSSGPGFTRLKLLIDDDVHTGLCHAVAEKLHTSGVVDIHPRVYMCTDVEHVYLNEPSSAISLLTRQNMHPGVEFSCTVSFILRCNIPDGDDVAIDSIAALRVLRIY